MRSLEFDDSDHLSSGSSDHDHARLGVRVRLGVENGRLNNSNFESAAGSHCSPISASKNLSRFAPQLQVPAAALRLAKAARFPVRETQVVTLA